MSYVQCEVYKKRAKILLIFCANEEHPTMKSYSSEEIQVVILGF